MKTSNDEMPREEKKAMALLQQVSAQFDALFDDILRKFDGIDVHMSSVINRLDEMNGCFDRIDASTLRINSLCGGISEKLDRIDSGLMKAMHNRAEISAFIGRPRTFHSAHEFYDGKKRRLGHMG